MHTEHCTLVLFFLSLLFFSNFYYDSRPCMSVMFTCLFLARKTAAIYKRHSSPADFFLSPPPFHTYIRNVHYPPYNRLLGLCEPFGLLFYFLLFLPTCDLIAELKKKTTIVILFPFFLETHFLCFFSRHGIQPAAMYCAALRSISFVKSAQRVVMFDLVAEACCALPTTLA